MPSSSSCLHSKTTCFSRGSLRCATAAAQPPPVKMNWFWSYCLYLYTCNFCVQLDWQSLQQLFCCKCFLQAFLTKTSPWQVSHSPLTISQLRGPHVGGLSCGSRFCNLCFTALFLAAGVKFPAQGCRNNQPVFDPLFKASPVPPALLRSLALAPSSLLQHLHGSILRDNAEG